MTKEEIKKVLDLALEYYKLEIFGTGKESQPPTQERIDYIYERVQPSLPSDLDEAARKYGHEEPILPEDYNDGDIPDYEEWTAEAFKAGAEWMAGQGVKIGETKIYLEDDGDEPTYSQQWLDLESTEFKIPDGAFEDGDEVEVILRKKQ